MRDPFVAGMSSSTPRPTILFWHARCRACRGHCNRPGGHRAVVHPLFIEDVAERVPVGGALHRHVDGIVGVADVRHHVLAPATASVPVASMVWIGFQRPPNRPVCGPPRSSGMPSANTLPRRMREAARTMSAGCTWLSVPIWSSAPQRPQFLSLSVASRIACFPTVRFIVPFPFGLCLDCGGGAAPIVTRPGRPGPSGKSAAAAVGRTARVGRGGSHGG